jgi:hypothetical protein
MAPRQASPAAAALNALGVSLSKESISKDQLLSVLKARRAAALRAPRLARRQHLTRALTRAPPARAL